MSKINENEKKIDAEAVRNKVKTLLTQRFAELTNALDKSFTRQSLYSSKKDCKNMMQKYLKRHFASWSEIQTIIIDELVAEISKPKKTASRKRKVSESSSSSESSSDSSSDFDSDSESDSSSDSDSESSDSD